LFASRLTPLKRADLVIRALAEPSAMQARCVIVGEGEQQRELQKLASDLNVAGRVTFAGQVTESELVDHLARCRAVVFPPVDEDYGLVTVEAFASRKPVITCIDSGGPVELVRDAENGFVVAPTPDALAKVFAQLMDSPGLAERLGEAAAGTAASMTWQDAVKRLVIV
jgi:glycosyltransferase involved in cell wall biosynthesis